MTPEPPKNVKLNSQAKSPAISGVSDLQAIKKRFREMTQHLEEADSAYGQLADLAQRSGASADELAAELNVSKGFALLLLEGANLWEALSVES